ncbi:MAG: hypothetical protein RIR18_1330 [Pseudomonadota bacterium]|jgi:Fe-S-cluster containining protein
MADAENPCLSCGACCAAYRVDFHPAELAGGEFAWGEGVSPEIVVRLAPNLVRMLGTDLAEPRCIALLGEIGESVICVIHPERPSPCREFETCHDACAKARARHHLRPAH